MTAEGTAPRRTRFGLRAAPWLLWFGVVGAGTAWSLHTLVDWGLDETVCRSGHDDVAGLPLKAVLVVLTVAFLAVAVASTAAAWVLWRRLDRSDPDEPVEGLRQNRASFMAVVGFVGGLLFSLIIVMSLVGVLVFPVCEYA